MKAISKSGVRHLLMSLVVTGVLLVLSYIAMNVPFPLLSDEKIKLSIFEHIKGVFDNADENAWTEDSEVVNWSDSVLLIDVHYDKTLVVEYQRGYKEIDTLPEGLRIEQDTYSPIGRIPVTDRKKLYDFLTFLKDRDDYRYIMVDILFDTVTSQPGDTLLYNYLLDSMRNVVIANDGDSKLADPRLVAISGHAIYCTALWETDFVKYPLIKDGRKSMPLKMYEDLTGNSLKKWGIFCSDKGIARNDIFLTYDLRKSDVEEKYLLGPMILGDTLDGNVLPTNLDSDLQTQGKYIVIGDFEDDKHNTFVGEMPGPLINMNTYIALVNEKHRLSIGCFLAYFFIFFLLSYLTISQNAKFKMIRTWIGYPVYLIIMCFILYILFNVVYEVVATTIVFYILNDIIQKRNLKTTKQ